MQKCSSSSTAQVIFIFEFNKAKLLLVLQAIYLKTNMHLRTNDILEQQPQEQDKGQTEQHNQEVNIIKKTRQITKNMDEQQRFEKAKAHILDALEYRNPRPYSQSPDASTLFRVVHFIKFSGPWEWTLFFFSYALMYLVVLDAKSFATKVGLETVILVVFWVDLVMKKYLKKKDIIGKNKEVPFFDWRACVLLGISIDLVIFLAYHSEDERPILPFRILRCFLPLMYDSSLRHTFFAIASAYMDILVFVAFFGIVVFGFALIGNRSLTINPYFRDGQNPMTIDPYQNDYESLSRMIFSMYILSSFDNYPDNEWFSIQNYKPNFIFFVVFIFLNYFLFTIIPGSLVYNKFRETWSKLILINELKQQHSLIIAFVTLAQDKTNLDIDTFVKFLYFLYRRKERYVQFIAHICVKIDQNNDDFVQVREFMNLGRAILDNSAMMPPSFDDLDCWVRFRNFMNQTFHLQTVVKHWVFELLVTIFIIWSFVNALIFAYDVWPLSKTLDDIFVWVFVVELLLRIIGFGPENFFAERWNNLDSVLVLLGLLFFFLPVESGASSISKIGRIFRVASLLRVISHGNFFEVKFRFFVKLKMLFQVLLEIMPIILKFIPLILFAFFAFAILGMELFYYSYSTAGSPQYNGYSQFASFRNFLQAQFMMVQIMIEEGWSTVAFDHCWRNPQYYGYVMLYFCLMHLVIVFILCTLIKGIFWEVYFTVDKIFTNRDNETQEENRVESQNEKREKQIQEIREQIKSKTVTSPETILKRYLYEKRHDQIVFQKFIVESKLRRSKELDSPIKNLIKSRKLQASGFISDFSASKMNVEGSNTNLSNILNRQLSDESSETQIQQIFHQILLDPEIKYSYVVGSGKITTEFMKTKFMKPSQVISASKFDLNADPLKTQESMHLHMSQIHTILHIETTQKEKKAEVLSILRKNNIIDADKYQELLRKKRHQMVFKIDTNGTLRKLFLSQTNSSLIRKFQVQYFSHLYKKSFKDINRLTLEPLLKVDATLTYAFRNILRYSQIQNLVFFEKLASIEDQYSNRVLKKGSLFKFVYKLEEDNTWFSVEFKNEELKIHFVKTGAWCYHRDMSDHQIYYSRDVFYWNGGELQEQNANVPEFMKRFYQSFQGLAYSLLDKTQFFSSNPHNYVFDLFVQTFGTQELNRQLRRNYRISKVMVVVLSKEERREELEAPRFTYELTDIRKEEEEPSFQFTFDDSENDTYEKLKNLTAKDHEKIVKSEGLPFAYIHNLLQQISDSFKSYGGNFTSQVEQVFNKHLKAVAARWENQQLRQREEAEQISQIGQQVNVKPLQLFFEEIES